MRWYVIPLNPMPWRVGPVYTGRSKVSGKLGGGVGRDQELHSFQESIRDELARQNPEKVEGQFKLTIIFFREVNEYKTWQSRRARNQEADGTNMYKATEDALAGILFDNDRDNVRGTFMVAAQAVGVDPCIVVGIAATSRQAVLDELKELLPPVVYESIYELNPGARLIDATSGSSSPSGESDEYADAPEVF